MKSIKNFLILLSLVSYGHAFAQLENVKLKVGPVEAKTKSVAFADLEPVGYDQTGSYYILTPYSEVMSNAIFTTRSYQVAHVSDEMIMDRIVPLELAEKGKELSYEFAMELNGTIYIFSSFQNHKIRKNFLFVSSLDKKTLTLNNDLRPVAELDYSDEGKYKRASFDYKLSGDLSKILITYNLLDKHNNTLRSGFNVLSSNFKLLSSQATDFPGSDGIHVFEEFKISNDGEVFLLTRYFSDEKTFEDHAKWKKESLLGNKRTYITKANYSYKITRFSGGKRDFKVYEVSIPGKFITALTMDIDNDNRHLICAGFTSDPGTTSVSGTCFMKIDDRAEKVVVKNHKDFSREFILEGLNAKEYKKTAKRMEEVGNFEDYRYVLKDIHFRADGGYNLIGEKVKEQLVNVKDGNVVTTRHLYLNKEIVVVNFNPVGEILWFRKVLKSQELVDQGYYYTSFSVNAFNDNLYFLFTNFDKKSANAFGKWKNTEANLVKMDPQGNQEQKTVLWSDKDHVTVRARDTQVLDGVLNLFGQQNENKYGFVKLSLN